MRYKGQLYFTEDEVPVEPAALPGSYVEFSLNGKPLGQAYVDVSEGTYYPAVSMYTHAHQVEPASVTVVFEAEKLKYPPLLGPGGHPALPVASIPGNRPGQ